MFKNVTIIGCGYVGLSMAVLLARSHKVKVLDIDKEKINDLNSKKSPIKDDLIIKHLKEYNLNIRGTTSKKEAFSDCDAAIISLPTNFIEEDNKFDTSLIESVTSEILKDNKDICIFIKSTVPIGFTEILRKKNNHKKIYFSPEFLREGKALEDNLYPSRIIVGGDDKYAKAFSNMLASSATKKDVMKIFMSSNEAESVKLFSNTYLALRVSFFNELDNFSEENKLNSKNIISGLCSDKRIGNFYNNPSFGFGGYCLPKDTKQLKSNLQGVPAKIIANINESNEERKNFIAKKILSKNIQTIGVYKLAMKKGSDNFRESAVIDIIKKLENEAEIFIYDEKLNKKSFMGHKVISNFKEFVGLSDIIVANRIEPDLDKYKSKIYTRDIFNND